MRRLAIALVSVAGLWTAGADAWACQDTPTAPHAFAFRNNSIAAPGFVGLTGDTPVVHGIDTSSAEANTNFTRARECGARFAYVRLSAGSNDRENTYRTNWGAARASGLIPGPFHRVVFANIFPTTAEARTLASADQATLTTAVDVSVQRATDAARAQAARFVARLQEVRRYDPGRPGDAEHPKPPYLPPILAIGDPMNDATPALRLAFGRAYVAFICTWISEVRDTLQRPDLPIGISIEPHVYPQYGLSTSTCGLDRIPIVIVHRPRDGDHFDATTDAARRAQIRTMCGYYRNRTARINRTLSRCRFDQYATRGDFAAFGDGDSPNLVRFFGTEDELDDFFQTE
jgi:hypothetical protein